MTSTPSEPEDQHDQHDQDAEPSLNAPEAGRPDGIVADEEQDGSDDDDS